MFHLRRFSFMLTAALCACAVVLPGSASAALRATVAPNPSAVTATGGAAKFTSNRALKVYNCATSAFRATLGSAAGGAPLPISSNVNWGFGGPCTVTGGLNVGFACTNVENFTVDGVTVAGVTPGQVGLDCTVSVVGARCSVQIVGSVLVSYDNATSTVTVLTTGQTLVAQNSSNGAGGACAPLPNDTSVTFSNAAGANLVLTVAPATTITVV
jgi:hypothetical protein